MNTQIITSEINIGYNLTKGWSIERCRSTYAAARKLLTENGWTGEAWMIEMADAARMDFVPRHTCLTSGILEQVQRHFSGVTEHAASPETAQWTDFGGTRYINETLADKYIIELIG